MRPSIRALVLASVGALLLALLFALWPSRRPYRNGLRHEEAKVIEVLGRDRIAGGLRLLQRHDTLITRFTGRVSRHDEVALRTIGDAGPTLAEKVAASRGPLGEPAEMALRLELPASELERRLGPPSSRGLVKYPGIMKPVEFASYGNLDVGVFDGEMILIRVR